MTVIYYPGYSQQQVQDNLIWQVIIAITQANPMVVTTQEASGYVNGMVVGFLIPSIYGMQQLNGRTGQVLSVSGTSITVNINSISFNPFSIPGQLPSAYSFPTIFPNNSGPYLPPLPLPYGNQNSLEGAIFNAGIPGDLI